MLKDRYFYPLISVVIAVMIFYAFSQDKHENLTASEIQTEGFVVRDNDLSKLTASHGTAFTFTKKSQKEKAYVTLKSNIARNDPPSLGVFVPLASNYHQAFAGQNLRITIRARQGKLNPLNYFDIGYFTAETGGSGWIRKTLTPEWKSYSIDYQSKSSSNDLGIDYFGIWPGEKGNKKTVDIHFIKIGIIPELKG